MRQFSFSISSFAAAILLAGAPHAHTANAGQVRASAPFQINTPFGIIYKIPSRDTVPYARAHPPGTIVVSTSERYLYYVLGNGQAFRYTIGVGREGHSFSGVSIISSKREWPDWSPTPNIRKLHPELPNYVKG